MKVKIRELSHTGETIEREIEVIENPYDGQIIIGEQQSDGWDVVKNIYKSLLSEFINQQTDKSWDGFQVWITHELKLIKKELDEVGIKVE